MGWGWQLRRAGDGLKLGMGMSITAYCDLIYWQFDRHTVIMPPIETQTTLKCRFRMSEKSRIEAAIEMNGVPLNE